MTNFDERGAIRKNFTFQFFLSYEGYNQFVKVLLIKVSDMLDSSNFVRLFHRQSFALYDSLPLTLETIIIIMNVRRLGLYRVPRYRTG